jgi:hypothetical protein
VFDSSLRHQNKTPLSSRWRGFSFSGSDHPNPGANEQALASSLFSDSRQGAKALVPIAGPSSSNRPCIDRATASKSSLVATLPAFIISPETLDKRITLALISPLTFRFWYFGTCDLE